MGQFPQGIVISHVTFDGGNIFAPGGKVELGGLINEGTVSFGENGNLDFSEDIQ